MGATESRQTPARRMRRLRRGHRSRAPAARQRALRQREESRLVSRPDLQGEERHRTASWPAVRRESIMPILRMYETIIPMLVRSRPCVLACLLAALPVTAQTVLLVVREKRGRPGPSSSPRRARGPFRQPLRRGVHRPRCPGLRAGPRARRARAPGAFRRRGHRARGRHRVRGHDPGDGPGCGSPRGPPTPSSTPPRAGSGAGHAGGHEQGPGARRRPGRPRERDRQGRRAAGQEGSDSDSPGRSPPVTPRTTCDGPRLRGKRWYDSRVKGRVAQKSGQRLPFSSDHGRRSITRMKRWIVLSLLLVPLLASAAGFWDGNAALQRGDAGFESGLYAASNSFPPGTQITIQNQDTGKTVTATITGRIEGQSDILVLLSPKTADALGLPQGTLGRVRVTVPTRADSTASAQAGDQTVSSDPDINPAAAYGAPDRTQVASAPPASPATARGGNPRYRGSRGRPRRPPPRQSLPKRLSPPPLRPRQPRRRPHHPKRLRWPSRRPHPKAPRSRLRRRQRMRTMPQSFPRLQSRTPQKQVFQPPREDEKFVYHPPVTVPPQAAPATIPAATPQAAPTITAVVGEPGVTPAAQPAADLALASPEPAPEGQAAQGPVQTEVTGPAAVPPAGQARRSSPFCRPKPRHQPFSRPPRPHLRPQRQLRAPARRPRQRPRRQKKSRLPWHRFRPPRLCPDHGAPGTYFLQLAAYGTEKVARDLAAKLAPRIPRSSWPRRAPDPPCSRWSSDLSTGPRAGPCSRGSATGDSPTPS